MARKQQFNKLHFDYPYFRPDGFPDLVYDHHTNVYPCVDCDRQGCLKCLGSGYVFLDPERAHAQILEMYENNKLKGKL